MTYAKTQGELAAAVGVSRRTILDWIKQPGFPPKTKRGWKVASVKAWREAKDAPDPLMAGVVSPALERYRVARAKLAELELRRQRGQYLPADTIMQGLSVFATTMRSAFTQLQREHGPEAYAVVSLALDDCEELFERATGKRPPDAPGRERSGDDE